MSNVVPLPHQPSQSLFPSEPEWRMLKEQAEMVVKTGFLPQAVNTPEKAITIALKGRELGIPPMQAFAHIHVIQGKPTISAELMLSLIYKNCPGAKVNYLETSDKACEIEAARPGHKPAKFRFTIQDAEKAKLLSKDSWRNYPGAMLRARTVAIVARAVFPDAIMGCSHIPEELGAEVDDEGQILDVQSEYDSAPKSQAVSNTQPPKTAGATAASDTSAAKPASVIAPAGEKTKAQLGAEIWQVAQQLGISKNELTDWVFELTQKQSKDLTVDEMKKCLEALYMELGRNQEQ